MLRKFMAVVALSGACGVASAQGPIDLNKLPAEISTLQWKGLDFSQAPLIDRCRALDLLNDALDEIRNQAAADADLMSQYLDDKGLGPAFASTAPIDDTGALTFDNGKQIALALLRGPMATSSYASSMAGVPDDQVAAFASMNLSSCQWKWNEMADRRSRVRAMSRFLVAQGKMADYTAWVPAEIERRTEERRAMVAQKEAAASKQAATQAQRARQHDQQEQAQQAAQEQQCALQVQQAMCAAQSQAAPAPAPTGGVVVPSDGGYPDWYYGGAAGLGAAALYRDAAFRGAACAATDHRMDSWHRAGGARRR